MARIYGGLLVTSKDVWTIAGTVRKTHDDPGYGTSMKRLQPLSLPPETERFHFSDQSSPKDALAKATERLIQSYPELCAIGVATYGPLQAVDPNLPGYGTVSGLSRHRIIRDLKIFDIVSDVLRKGQSREIPVAVHTDVMAGALAEFARRSFMDCRYKKDTVEEGQTLAFIHVSDGIGGAFASGSVPIIGAHHPEVGYIAAQIDPRDSWGQRQLAVNEGINQMVVIEDVASEGALRTRTGQTAPEFDDGGWIPQIPKKLWNIESYYVSQLCASMTMMLAPHKIILHSEFIGNDLLNQIRGDFDRWVSRRGGRYLRYKTLDDEATFIQRPLKPAPMRFGALCLAIKADLGV